SVISVRLTTSLPLLRLLNISLGSRENPPLPPPPVGEGGCVQPSVGVRIKKSPQIKKHHGKRMGRYSEPVGRTGPQKWEHRSYIIVPRLAFPGPVSCEFPGALRFLR